MHIISRCQNFATTIRVLQNRCGPFLFLIYILTGQQILICNSSSYDRDRFFVAGFVKSPKASSKYFRWIAINKIGDPMENPTTLHRRSTPYRS
jgi:hypothetical protein